MNGRELPHSAWHGTEGSSGVDQQLTSSNGKTEFPLDIDDIRGAAGSRAT